MMAALKKGLIAVAVLAASVTSVVLIRTFAWKPAPFAVEPIPRLEIDEAAIERLAGAIRLPTVSRVEAPDADFDAFDALHRHLEDCFPRVYASLVHELIGGQSLLFTWNGEDPAASSVLLLAHMDVVPVEPGTESKWIHGPFAGDVADGFVWGRGTLDDKASVMAILEAVEILLKQGFKPRGTVLLAAFGHDEEIGGQSGAARIASLLRSRGIRVSYVLDEGSAVTDGIVPGLDRPAALVGIAEKGFATVELSALSPGGHSSMPPPQTAVGIVAAAIHALGESHPMPAALYGPAALLFDRLGPEMPFLTKLPLANRWLFGALIVGRLEAAPTTAAILRTTTAATIFEGGIKENILPARARRSSQLSDQAGRLRPRSSSPIKVVGDRRVQIRSCSPPARLEDPSPISRTRSGGFATIERTIRQVLPRARRRPLPGPRRHGHAEL